MSAFIRFNKAKKEICIEAKLYFYGNLASEQIAEGSVKEINDFWNAPAAIFSINEKNYAVKFDIKGQLISTVEAASMLKLNTDYRNNFIRVEEKNKVARSLMGFSLGENAGHWLVSDNLGSSTTAAHEFGHALGLPHPTEIDYRNTGVPPIMAPRGTWVDAVYQWNPLAPAGEVGGTLKPIFRRVRSEEVLMVLAKVVEEKDQTLGKITNYFFDEMANII